MSERVEDGGPAQLPCPRRPLAWQEGVYITTDDDNGPMEGTPRELLAWSAAPYVIIRQSSPDGSFILRGKHNGIGLIVSTLDEAKSAAQADYEAADAMLAARSPSKPMNARTQGVEAGR